MGTYARHILSIIAILALGLSSFATPLRTTYQAKIVKPDGYPLEAASVNFRFTILDPSASCAIYVEDYAAVNMQDSGGLISFSLGSGVRSFPTSGTTATFANVFNNSTPSFSCVTPGIYSPTVTDNRKIVMQFQDTSGWQTLPAMTINAVPYAMYAGLADNSNLFNNKADTAFVQYSTIPTCIASQALQYNGASFVCIAAGGGGSSYTVTAGDVTSALGYTPVSPASHSTVTSTVSSLGTSLTTVTSLVNNLTSSMTSMVSSQWVTSGTSISYNAGNVGISGRALIGSQAASATFDFGGILGANATYKSPLLIQETINDMASEYTLGYGSSLKLNPVTGTNNIAFGGLSFVQTEASNPASYSLVYAHHGIAEHRGSGAITDLGGVGGLALANTSGTLYNLRGLEGHAYVVAGEVTHSMGGQFESLNMGLTPIINNYGVRINSAAGLINNNYGLYVHDQSTAGSSSTYNIFSEGSNSRNVFMGLVGIGTTTPITKLEVSGGIKISMEAAACSVNYAGTLRYSAGNVEFCNGSSWSALGVAGASIDLGSAQASGTLAAARLPAFSGDASSSIGSSVLTLANVGAGVTSGTQYTKVRVDGKGRVTSGSQLAASDITTALGYTPGVSGAGGSQWVTSGTAIHYASGNVGIGTVAPSTVLEVKGGSLAGVQEVARFGYNLDSNTPGKGIRLGLNSFGTVYIGSHYASNAPQSYDMTFGTYNGGTAERMRITGAGHVGVGISAPAYPLSVSGTIYSNTGFRFPDSSTQTTASIRPQILLGGGNITITTSTSGTLSTQNWVAPATGNVMLTFNKKPPYVFSGCAGGNLGFSIRVNGTEGSLTNQSFITNIHRLANGDVHFAPAIDIWSVTAGVTYTITTEYFSQSFSSCTVNTTGNSSGSDHIKLEYVQ